MQFHRFAVAATAALVAAACGGGSKHASNQTCVQTGCSNGQVCESVATGGNPICADPVYVSGRVYDLSSSATPKAGVGGARVVGQDVNGAPVSSVAISSTNSSTLGAYELRISVAVPRNADGSPASGTATLRADAQGFATFPSGLRVALPIALTSATHANGKWSVANGLTDVGLNPIASAPTGQITGTVALPSSGGVLVVADCGGTAYTAVPGSDGTYAIYNVAASTCTVTGYAKGVSYSAVSGVAVNNNTVTANLALSGAATTTVNGSVSFVSKTDWPSTSVLIVVASTYDPVRQRGISPPGFVATGITNGSGWSIAGIPDGHYRVLSSLGTDYIVRDPSKSNTVGVLEFWVSGGAMYLADPSVGSPTAVTTLGGFKVTGAVRLLGPISDGTASATCTTLSTLPADPGTLPVGGCASTSNAPTITWEAYSSTSQYDVSVVDETGTVAWKGTAMGSGTTSITVGTALTSGRTYQVRIIARPTDLTNMISTSEDLLGVFTVP